MDNVVGSREPHTSEQIVKSIADIGKSDGMGFRIREDIRSRLIELIVNEEANRTRSLFELRTRIWELEEAIEELSGELRTWELSALRAGEGAARISYERARQQVEEGYGATHDDDHEYGELAQAATAYAMSDKERFPHSWAPEHWKPQDRIRNLEKAGALIAAEIDRLLRARNQKGEKPEQPDFDSRTSPSMNLGGDPTDVL